MTPQTYVFHAGTTMEVTVLLDDTGLHVKYPSKEIALDWNVIVGAGVMSSRARRSKYPSQESPTSKAGTMARVYNSTHQVVIGYQDKKGKERAIVLPLSNDVNAEAFIRALRERPGTKWLSGLGLHYASLKWMRIRPSRSLLLRVVAVLVALALLGWWTGWFEDLLH